MCDGDVKNDDAFISIYFVLNYLRYLFKFHFLSGALRIDGDILYGLVPMTLVFSSLLRKGSRITVELFGLEKKRENGLMTQRRSLPLSSLI